MKTNGKITFMFAVINLIWNLPLFVIQVLHGTEQQNLPDPVWVGGERWSYPDCRARESHGAGSSGRPRLSRRPAGNLRHRRHAGYRQPLLPVRHSVSGAHFLLGLQPTAYWLPAFFSLFLWLGNLRSHSWHLWTTLILPTPTRCNLTAGFLCTLRPVNPVTSFCLSVCLSVCFVSFQPSWISSRLCLSLFPKHDLCASLYRFSICGLQLWLCSSSQCCLGQLMWRPQWIQICFTWTPENRKSNSHFLDPPVFLLVTTVG